jgi:hypothetical protein
MLLTADLSIDGLKSGRFLRGFRNAGHRCGFLWSARFVDESDVNHSVIYVVAPKRSLEPTAGEGDVSYDQIREHPRFRIGGFHCAHRSQAAELHDQRKSDFVVPESNSGIGCEAKASAVTR